jgi:phage-related protein (TIGR01555 family)
VKWGRLYGGAIGVLQIQGQKLDTPLNLDSVGLNQFKGIGVYDRWQLNPDLVELIQEGPEIGLPAYYDIVLGDKLNNDSVSAKTVTGQVRVHHSRCIRMIGHELPFFQAITEMMWGESVLERLWDRLISFDDTTLSAANLVDRAQLRTVQVDGLREIIAAGGKAKQGLIEMFEMVRQFQINEGLTLLDKNDIFSATAYSFAGVSDILLQFGQQLAGASGIPLVRLFGQSPAGLSATGESDIRMYYDNINAQQNARLGNPIEIILQVLYRSIFGKPAPSDLTFTFTPLWQMTAIDKATITKTNTESIIAAHQEGAIDRPTMMKELRASSGDDGLFGNITDESITEAEKDEDEPPMPGDPTSQLPVPSKGPAVKNIDAKPSWFRKLFSKRKAA